MLLKVEWLAGLTDYEAKAVEATAKKFGCRFERDSGLVVPDHFLQPDAEDQAEILETVWYELETARDRVGKPDWW